MKYLLLMHDNADTRERLFGPEDALGAELDTLMVELQGHRRARRR